MLYRQMRHGTDPATGPLPTRSVHAVSSLPDHHRFSHRWAVKATPPAGRGERYVVAQVLLIGLVLAGPRQVYGWPAVPWPAASMVSTMLASVMIGAGLLLAAAGTVHLGRNLTPLPRPRASGTLVQQGIYRLARHPIYGGLMLVAVGWALTRGGGLTLVWAGLLVAVLAAKSRDEERRLAAKFPEYVDYRRRSRRFLPFLW